MAAAMVTMAELRSNLGIGSLYSDATVEECCQSAEDLIQGYLWHNDAPVVASSISNNVATLVLSNPGIFNTGQSITVSNCGATYNGTYTLTGSFPGTTVPASIGTMLWSTYALSSYPTATALFNTQRQQQTITSILSNHTAEHLAQSIKHRLTLRPLPSERLR